ncbi:hypothetical protein BDP55DRAFT_673116 [Colletotrichum godetiae]|uniref:Uncharacterized protein n=1 Tax=Colletotrichum godetiae TaxID=1209918 RepID=A0AAJ0AHH5_9PEZI|nr:uncharacterized protein BDP55DRAFT_673116 [Colletotrichum godetiae]KAK1672437.1 hypothetical protein BDP55DRAFT_673116 [Colletotrichum godetiae]
MLSVFYIAAVKSTCGSYSMRLEPLPMLTWLLVYTASVVVTPMAASQILMARLGRHASAHSYRVLVFGISVTTLRIHLIPRCPHPSSWPPRCALGQQTHANLHTQWEAIITLYIKIFREFCFWVTRVVFLTHCFKQTVA